MLIRLVRLGVDALVASIAVVLGYWLAIGGLLSENASPKPLLLLIEGAATYGAIAGVVGYAQRTYRAPWRFASVRDVLALTRGATITAGVFLALAFVFNRAHGYPRSTFVLAWGLHVCGLASIRLLARSAHEKALFRSLIPFLAGPLPRRSGMPLLLVGAPHQAEAFLREIDQTGEHAYRPVGIITPDGGLMGSELRTVAVLGPVDSLEAILAGLSADLSSQPAILFLDQAHKGLQPALLARLKREGYQLLRRHRIDELAGDDVRPFRELSFEELLFRQPVQLITSRATAYLMGKRVLVTGAGGSIGSELCRQVAALGAAHVCLLDFSEFNLFEIDREIGNSYPAISRTTALCNVRDSTTIERWIRAERPDVLFHAAALKHVGLVEQHPAEGVLTNVIGSANVALSAQRLGVPHMVTVSTDKAVSPRNVMGATKRLAEDFVLGLGRGAKHGATRFNVVRFGNVLGSTGSVVPIFRDQIARGGPVTITHPDVERFFMTIQEAVQLVLHASAVGADSVDREGGVYVLDMGKPVKIVDLARQIIELHGLDPDVDMPIRIIGLRAGEKLSEELIDTNERIIEKSEGIIRVGFREEPQLLTLQQLRQLQSIALQEDEAALRSNIQALIKTCDFHTVAA